MEREKLVFGTEEAVARLIIELMKSEKKRIKLLTDLSDEEIMVLSLLSTIGEKLKLNVLNKFCSNFCLYRVSKARAGRKEFVNIATYTTGEMTETKRRKGIKDLFGGLR